MIGEQQRRCAVVGSPIEHSLSPVLHRAAYAEAGLDWRYDAVELAAEDLAGFVDGLDPTWRGLSLTMPLKRTVLPLLDEITDRASQARAVNTLILDEGRRVGHNTDVPGAVAALRERLDPPVGTAVVLGGGATATSVLLALADLGCAELTLVVRDPDRAQEALAAARRHPRQPQVRTLGFEDAPPETDLLVSTIPSVAQRDLALTFARPVPAVFDVVYDRWPTPLMRHAVETGKTLVTGLDLLVHQACGQFALMTGVQRSPVAVMRRAGEQALVQRGAGG